MFERYLAQDIASDLKEKMVFISGPRQVGKTTLAEGLGAQLYAGKTQYLNWDSGEDRRNIIAGRFEPEKELMVFDEIHKYKKWKNYLKGLYDKNKSKLRILATGSARLNVYRKGGDSLLGRYRHYRLHPLSLAELSGHAFSGKPFEPLSFHKLTRGDSEILSALLALGGFPQIYFKGSAKNLRRWHNERADLLVKEDIRDIENIRDLSALQVLVALLPSKVGSVLSINSIREELEVNYRTAALWIDVLERFYYHFRIYPYQNSAIKSLKKESKLYLWDWSEVPDAGARYENLMASHLLKFTDYLFDAEGYKAGLYFLRDREQRETDFVVTLNDKPWFIAEVKSSAKGVSKPLKYFSAKLAVPLAYQVVLEPGIDFVQDSVRVLSADKFLSALM
jgi:predicted AAA+ superfamily ATPase